jgi:hypothetical protein
MRKANEMAQTLFPKSAHPGHKKRSDHPIAPLFDFTPHYSTVTDLARFLGWSTFLPRMTAM